jgi:hypothetical protein
MTGRTGVSATLSAAIVFALIACAPAVQPQPADPTKVQITVLQKQLLELQNLQNENRKKVEEQAAITEALSSKVKALEDRQSMSPVSSPSPHQISSVPSSTQKVATEKKKTAKKKKKKKTVRRQEQ